MEFDKYKHFSVEDFVLDLQFKEEALRSSGEEEETAFFRTLLSRFPHQRQSIIEARKIVLRLEGHYRRQLPGAGEKAAIYQDIIQRHEQMKNKPGANGKPVLRRSWVRASRAAAAALLLLLAVNWLLRPEAERGNEVLHTDFAQVKDYQLPDGSTVSLNANSTLRFAQDWSAGKIREVWLEGEAFFSVVKRESDRAKFVVHTNGPDIEVLGTEFNVNTRREKTLIMLEEGKIQLKQRDGQGAPQILQERQLVEYSPGKAYSIRSNVDPVRYRSWREGYIPVDDLTFADIALKAEEIYGVKISAPEQMLDQRLIEGAIPTNNLEELLETLKTLFEVTTEEENGTLHLYIH